MDKHFSLLRTFVNYVRKKFYNTGPECCTGSFHHCRHQPGNNPVNFFSLYLADQATLFAQSTQTEGQGQYTCSRYDSLFCKKEKK
jgi:hypothetical protein